jgi:formamidopyrimidine-DNA glycosylase
MPELPEVETIARDLAPLVTGATIVHARADWPRMIVHPAPDEFPAAIRGRVIERVGRRAKWIVVELSGGLVLAIGVRMTGQVFVVPREAPADRHVHLVIGLDGGRELRLRDMRKFARVGVYRRLAGGGLAGWAASDAETAGGDPFRRHGPEPLEKRFTLAVFRRRLRARRGRLKPLLLDQAFIAGIGNIYADEALWRARLHPLRTVATLRPADERGLYRAIQEVLLEAIERRGSSVDDYTAPAGDGEMQEHLAVYQRTALPCLRCGRPLRRIVLGGRGTHFCSWCQRLPAVDRAGAAPLLRGVWLSTGARVGQVSEATRRAATTRRAQARRGTRWTELPAGAGAVGLRPGEGRGRSGERDGFVPADRGTADAPPDETGG